MVESFRHDNNTVPMEMIEMMAASLLPLLSSLFAAGLAPPPVNAMPIRVSATWSVEVGPGTVLVDGKSVVLSEAVTLTVPALETIHVRDEQHPSVPVFNPKAGGWGKGIRPNGIIAQECTSTGVLYPDRLRVKPAAGDSQPYTLDTDYAMDDFWGTFGRIEGGAIGAEQAVFVDYDHELHRLDTIALDADGNVRLVVGTPHVALPLPPELPKGSVALANVWIPGRTTELSDENLYPIEYAETTPREPVAERLLPKTLAKVRAGERLTIVAWGDSVTAGGGVNGQTELYYQNVFVKRLAERFPEADIALHSAAWPGGNSMGYMTAPAGGTYDYARDVLERKPDLVTIEFVNDAGLDEAGVAAHYAQILGDLRGIGAEVILITPHFVRPDWMNVDTLKVDEDPRPYVKGLRQFARANQVALADASLGWGRLWREGIPYLTLLGNAINHPDARGHRIFADALMALFPEK